MEYNCQMGVVCRRDLVCDILYKRVGEVMLNSSSTALCSFMPYPLWECIDGMHDLLAEWIRLEGCYGQQLCIPSESD
jgi:hypothetical protein